MDPTGIEHMISLNQVMILTKEIMKCDCNLNNIIVEMMVVNVEKYTKRTSISAKVGINIQFLLAKEEKGAVLTQNIAYLIRVNLRIDVK